MIHEYRVLTFWSDDDQGYIAILPVWWGLSAYGESIEVAIEELRIVVDMAIAIYQENGWQLPDPNGKVMLSPPKSMVPQ